MKHTKGPWRAHFLGMYGINITAGTSTNMTNIAHIKTPVDPHAPYEEQKANAQLIVAAPELLDALTYLVNQIFAEELAGHIRGEDLERIVQLIERIKGEKK